MRILDCDAATGRFQFLMRGVIVPMLVSHAGRPSLRHQRRHRNGFRHAMRNVDRRRSLCIPAPLRFQKQSFPPPSRHHTVVSGFSHSGDVAVQGHSESPTTQSDDGGTADHLDSVRQFCSTIVSDADSLGYHAVMKPPAFLHLLMEHGPTADWLSGRSGVSSTEITYARLRIEHALYFEPLSISDRPHTHFP